MNFAELEAALGLAFTDKSLLQRALTHRSYLNENPDVPWLDNERLEFLGDAILGFVTAEYLYHRFPEMQEGDLTLLRAALVRGRALSEYARQVRLPEFVLVSRGEIASGGPMRTALLATTFEALLGAVYLDQGYAAAHAFILRFVTPEVEHILEDRLDRDAKSLLQELSQGRLQVTPAYRTVDMRGPDHAKEFTVEVYIGDRAIGRGTGRSKQSAEQDAARAAIIALETELEGASSFLPPGTLSDPAAPDGSSPGA